MEKEGLQVEQIKEGKSVSTDRSSTMTEDLNQSSAWETSVSTARTLESEETTPVSTDRSLEIERSEEVTPVSTGRSYGIENSEEETPVSTTRTLQTERSETVSSDREKSVTLVATDRVLRSEPNGDFPRKTLQREQCEVQTSISPDTYITPEYEIETQVLTDKCFSKETETKDIELDLTPINPDKSHKKTESGHHKLSFTPPLDRPKDQNVDSVGIIQELRKDGLLCSTPLIPRNTRQTRSGISFEYYFGAGRATPRILPRLRSDGNISKTITQREKTIRRESPIRKTAFRRKSGTSCKAFRWHTGCLVTMENRRVQRDQAEKRREQAQHKDEWKVTGQFWQAVREKQEKERKENEERRARERKILHGLMGRNYKDTFP